MRSDIEIILIEELKGVDKTAEVNPMMSKLELEALTLDIKANGQLEPITVCRNLIVDGRNRVKALKALGITEVKINKLVRSTTVKEKRKLVMSKEVRRHQTPTQKACTSVIEWNNNKPKDLTQKEFIAKYSVSQGNFTNAQWLYKNNRQVFDVLRDGKQVNIDRENKYKTSDSLNAVVKFYKQLSVGVDPKVSDDVDNVLKSKVGAVINPLLDAMLFSLNSLNLSDDEIKKVKEDIAIQMYAKFKNN